MFRFLVSYFSLFSLCSPFPFHLYFFACRFILSCHLFWRGFHRFSWQPLWSFGLLLRCPLGGADLLLGHNSGGAGLCRVPEGLSRQRTFANLNCLAASTSLASFVPLIQTALIPLKKISYWIILFLLLLYLNRFVLLKLTVSLNSLLNSASRNFLGGLE